MKSEEKTLACTFCDREQSWEGGGPGGNIYERESCDNTFYADCYERRTGQSIAALNKQDMVLCPDCLEVVS